MVSGKWKCLHTRFTWLIFCMQSFEKLVATIDKRVHWAITTTTVTVTLSNELKRDNCKSKSEMKNSNLLQHKKRPLCAGNAPAQTHYKYKSNKMSMLAKITANSRSTLLFLLLYKSLCFLIFFDCLRAKVRCVGACKQRWWHVSIAYTSTPVRFHIYIHNCTHYRSTPPSIPHRS